MGVLTLAALLAVMMLLAFFRSSLWGWLLAAVVFIPVIAIQHRVSADAFQVVIVALALLVAVLGVPLMRRTLVSGPLLGLLRRTLPQVPQPERETLDAGTVGWEAELFGGSPDWNKLLALPAPALKAPERAFLNDETERLCAMLGDWDAIHVRRDLPPPVWQFLKDKGFFGMSVPKEYGGLGFSAQMRSAVIARIASRCAAAAMTVAAPDASGLTALLLGCGTPEQKEKYLRGLARGSELPCLALTGASDAAAMPDYGIVCRDESGALGIRLTWEKSCVALAPVATLIGLAFRLYDPERLLGGERERGITLALVPADAPGVEIGRRHVLPNPAFQAGPTAGKDVFIPLDGIIGGEAGIGRGWRMLEECRAAERAVSLPAAAVGGGKLAARSSGAWRRVHEQSRAPTGRFGGQEAALARIGGNLYAMDAARQFAVLAVDRGERPAVIAAIVESHCTEGYRAIVGDAPDLLDGNGVCLGPENPLGQHCLQAPFNAAMDGAGVFAQAAARAHPYVQKEIRAARDEDGERAVRDFDAALFGHLSFALSNAARAFVFGLTGGRGIQVHAENPARRYFQRLTRYSAAFALLADAATPAPGGGSGRRENLSRRLGDALGRMVLCCAALKRFEDDGCPAEDLPLLHWAMQDALYHIQADLDGVLRNLPLRPLAWVLRALIFPLGRCAAPPPDRLGREIATLLMQPSAARDRLTAGMYLPEDENEPLGALEAALKSTLQCEALYKRVEAERQAGRLRSPDELARFAEARDAGVISVNDALLLERDYALRRKVGTVDDFAPEEPAPAR